MQILSLSTRPVLRMACVCMLLHGTFPAIGAPQQAADTGSISITILDGDNAIANVRQRVSREAIVQVEDENHKPVAGAIVTFLSPSDGPSATFVNGSHTITATTDAQGRVLMRGITPNNVSGKFQIRVTASHNGRTASTTLTQTNVVTAATAAGSAGGISGKTLAILLGVGGAAAAGIAVGLAGGKSSSPSTPSTPTVTSVTLQPGTPTVGPPH